MSNTFYCVSCQVPIGNLPLAAPVTCPRCGRTYQPPAVSRKPAPPSAPQVPLQPAAQLRGAAPQIQVNPGAAARPAAQPAAPQAAQPQPAARQPPAPQAAPQQPQFSTVAQQPAPAAAPQFTTPQANTPGVSVAAAPSLPTKPVGRRRTAPGRFQPASSWLDFFDWKFERYLTPIIIRITWIITLIVAGLYLITRFIDIKVGLTKLPESVIWLIQHTYEFIFTFVMLLWARVVLETTIVLFNMANSLRNIDDKLD